MELVSANIEDIIASAERVSFKKGDILGEQYAKCNYLYLVVEGTIGLYYDITSMGEEVLIGMASFHYAPIGLAVFHHPFRNESTYKVISEEALLLRWSKAQIDELLESDPRLAAEFVNFIGHYAHDLIKVSTELFSDTPITTKSVALPDKPSEGFDSSSNLDQTDTIIFLIQSPFMEVFDEHELEYLSEHIERKEYQNGDILALQGHETEGIRILESGEVQFARGNSHNGKDYNIVFRNISTPGYMLGSSGSLHKRSILTSTVIRDSIILYIPSKALDDFSQKSPAFALKYQTRILWMIKNQLRAIRARLVSAQHDEEITVITSMIDSNKSKLNVNSQLHKIPHLLQGKLTVGQVFEILHHVELNGSTIEKNLASLCLDNLQQTKKEYQFYTGLMNVYNSVVDAPDGWSKEQIRVNCIKSTKDAYQPASVLVKGFEHLPDTSGNIVIYNHLLNDLYYTLPNHFNITQDSHFISSLLFEKYGRSSERIVRIGDSIEFGHQEYYEKLDFIGVYTIKVGSKKEAHERREVLFEKLKACLAEDRNLIVSPEGTSHITEHSPGPFKSGMFKMIQRLETEPLIIPIVMVNFDKRVKNSKFACQIRAPFKLSTKMREYGESDLKAFLIRYQQEYRRHVEILSEEVSKMMEK